VHILRVSTHDIQLITLPMLLLLLLLLSSLQALALRYGCGLHVDCCLGGFFLPFAKRVGQHLPAYDFALLGVTSMSCDTHKYGYASKGTSVVLYRDKALRAHQVIYTYTKHAVTKMQCACTEG
jgi:glutamate/tyrosine decarboxylase-like PLP-dependent enzyme